LPFLPYTVNDLVGGFRIIFGYEFRALLHILQGQAQPNDSVAFIRH
jgi:hypothetical protein